LVVPTFGSAYEVAIYLNKKGLLKQICKKLKIKNKKIDLNPLKKYVAIEKQKSKLTIGILGNSESFDSFVSINEAVKHAAISKGFNAKTSWFPFNKTGAEQQWLNTISGAIVCEDLQFSKKKLSIIRQLREKNIPLLGISAGSHLCLIEFLRNAAGNKNANSPEIDAKTTSPCTVLKPLTLGEHSTKLSNNSLSKKIYNKKIVKERYRYYANINPKTIRQCKKYGLKPTGISLKKGEIDFVEYSKNSFYLLTMAHPEFRSRPLKPHPLFKHLIENAEKYSRKKEN